MFPRHIFRKLVSRPRRQALPRPRLADAVELLGPYKDSGYKEPPYLARRADGQIVQLTRLLHLVAAACDGRRDALEIAQRVSDDFGRTLSVENVLHLVGRKLQPMGLVAGPGDVAAAPRATAPLAFTVRRAIVPAAVVDVLAKLFKPLFRPTAIGAALASLGLFDAWLVTHGDVAAGVREVLARPVLLLALFGLALLATVFHEIGHAAACRYGGAVPGAMGAGLYLVWPAFYTDVTDAYRLDRRGRLRTDLGGIYFNGLFVLALAAAYFETHFRPLLVVAVLQHFQALQQLVPWVRLDGYYVVSDLAGVPDILSRTRPALLSLVPGRSLDPRIAELKTWSRTVVRLYVLTVVPVLAAMYILLALSLPRFVGQARRSFVADAARTVAAWHAGDLAALALALLGMVALALPSLGLALIIVRTAGAVARLVGRMVLMRPWLRAFALATGAVALFAVGATTTRARIRTAARRTTSTPPSATVETMSAATTPSISTPSTSATTTDVVTTAPTTTTAATDATSTTTDSTTTSSTDTNEVNP